MSCPPWSSRVGWGKHQSKSIPYSTGRDPQATLPKAREAGDIQHLPTRLLGVPFSALGCRHFSCWLTLTTPASRCPSHHSGIRGKAEETQDWQQERREEGTSSEFWKEVWGEPRAPRGENKGERGWRVLPPPGGWLAWPRSL